MPDMSLDENHSNPPSGQFATTQWSLVLAAGQRGSEESDHALEKLCRAYWPALYAYARRRVSDIHQAQDLTQAFFARLLQKEYLTQADPKRGRFRAFLITSFKHFLSNQDARASALKRGGDRRRFTFDFAAQDETWGGLAEQTTAERIYERQWSVTLLNRVMSHLQREMERSGKGQQFQVLKQFIGGTSDSSYADAARALNLNESAARMAASRLRRRYRALLRDEIAQTVTSADEIDEEIRQLFATFSV